MRIEEDAHPGRLTWNLQITHLERNMIFQISMIMFHVHLPGCTFLLEKLKASRFLMAGWVVEWDGISFASEQSLHVRSFWLWLYVRPQQRWLRLGKKHTHTQVGFHRGDEVIPYPGSKKQCKTSPTFWNHLPNILLKSLNLVCNFFKISVEHF